MKIKVSDYIINFLEQKGVCHMFFLPGGGCMHLLNALAENKKIEGVSLLHEQAAAIAAESYSFCKGQPGALLVTTGPGGTNAVTGVLSAYIDSIPYFVLSGQVKRSDLKSRYGVRALGSQEADIIAMVKGITKYAVIVMDPEKIRYDLERAWFEMLNGRKGPVWLDIPLDVQGASVDPEKLQGFTPQRTAAPVDEASIQKTVSLLQKAKRPVILAGNGLRGCQREFENLMDLLRIPVIPTWKAADLFPDNHPLYVGRCGTLGERAANFAMQQADVLLSIGCRLDFSVTGFEREKWAQHAVKIVVDIDAAELRKLEAIEIDISIRADAADVIDALRRQKWTLPSISPWKEKIRQWKARYPVTGDGSARKGMLSTYDVTHTVCEASPENIVFIPASAGTVAEIFYQALTLKPGQMVRSNHGLGAMGFEIPASIGAYFALRRPVACIAGDGGMQLNIQELASISARRLPVKIFVVDNGGYASIRGMQKNHFHGRYFGCSSENGLFLPDICQLAQAYGIPAVRAQTAEELHHACARAFSDDGPFLCAVTVDPQCVVTPRVASRVLQNGQMASAALEDMSPFLSAEEFAEALRIPESEEQEK